MRRKFLLYSLLLCGLTSFAQVETKEHFVHEVLQQTSYSYSRKIWLQDTAQGWGHFDFIDSTGILGSDVKQAIPDTAMDQIIANCSKSYSEKWGSIGDIKVVYIGSDKVLRQKRGTSMYKHESVFISNVVFDNGHTFAMVRIGRTCGKYCGDSCVYLFKKTDNKWRLISKTGCIIV